MIGFASKMVEPQDQEMWKWKMEPESPKGTSIEDVEDDWFICNDKSLEFTKYAADEPVMYDDQLTNRAQVATKLLEQLNEWIKEETFSDWLEERTNLPIFEELETPECQNKSVAYPAIIKNQQQQYNNTQTLLEEFETVLEDVEACHQIIPSSVSTLTPPQSPPPNKSLTVDTQLLVTLQPVQTIQPVISSQQQQQLPVYNIIVSPEKQQQQPAIYQNEVCVPEQWNPENVSLDPLGGGDVANDLAVVDEYVRSHTEDIPTAYSPCTSPSGSCVSSEDSTSDDPDWIADTSCNKKQSTSIGKKNQYKPYSRPTVEDKKVRKKEQNKNAATRYRQKKKQEIKDILGEEHELTEYNEKLQGQVKDLQREIGYLKGLMRDLFKAKGLIK